MIHTVWQAGLWVAAQVVFALVGYYQGRRDEEIYWRRVVGNLDKRTGQGGST